jgi:hypothetical protein
MRFVFFVVAVVFGLMLLSIYDLGTKDAARRAAADAKISDFRCRAPDATGQYTVITVYWSDGALVGDCDYLINQFSPKGG